MIFNNLGFRDYSLKIFNRWGELVHASYNFPPNDPEYGWNGWFKEQHAAQGVYVYKVRYINLIGEEETVAGDITLVR